VAGVPGCASTVSDGDWPTFTHGAIFSGTSAVSFSGSTATSAITAGLVLDELAEGDQTPLHVGVERRADRRVTQRSFGELERRTLGVDVRPQVARAPQRRFVVRPHRLQAGARRDR
jgi:hypothetical protein